METVTSTRPTRPGKNTEDLTLTPLPNWESYAEVVLSKAACGSLCIHACFSGASPAPARQHR
ncbi:hypothetical protein [Streptomyces sp. NPDC059918]|uniref:hypothetical protein n=1 Tax=unclassified Streptomyces TaxID=2593676 RepID=UPI00364CF7D9